MTPSPHQSDVLILGGGSAGYAAALRSAQLGMKVTLVEKEKIGGTCLHAGCIPTKALLRVAEIADEVHKGAGMGLSIRLDDIDGAAIQTYKAGVVSKLHRGLEGLLAGSPLIDVIAGHGSLVGPDAIEVDGTRFTAQHVILATGSTPKQFPGVATSGRVLTSTGALDLDEVPRRAVIIGGSVIGVEFASAWRSLGADVTIVEALPSLVPLEDPTIGKQLARAFRRRKIACHTGVGMSSLEERGDEVTVTLDDGTTLDADYVLVAIGRSPVTGGLGLETAGVALDGQWVATDERLRTSVPGIYAVGDLVRGLQLAHRSFAHGMFVAEEIAGLEPEPVLDRTIPRITYCEPEIASVGLTEPLAREVYGDEVKVQEYNLAGNGKSLLLDSPGVVKLIATAGGQIVGGHMIGTRMGEQSGELALQVSLGLHAEDLARIVHAHPTQNEAVGEALLALAGKPLHSHQ